MVYMDATNQAKTLPAGVLVGFGLGALARFPEACLVWGWELGNFVPLRGSQFQAQELRDQVPNQRAARVFTDSCFTMGQSDNVQTLHLLFTMGVAATSHCVLNWRAEVLRSGESVDQKRAACMCPVKFLQQHAPQERNRMTHKTFASSLAHMSNTYLPAKTPPTPLSAVLKESLLAEPFQRMRGLGYPTDLDRKTVVKSFCYTMCVVTFWMLCYFCKPTVSVATLVHKIHNSTRHLWLNTQQPPRQLCPTRLRDMLSAFVCALYCLCIFVRRYAMVLSVALLAWKLESCKLVKTTRLRAGVTYFFNLTSQNYFPHFTCTLKTYKRKSVYTFICIYVYNVIETLLTFKIEPFGSFWNVFNGCLMSCFNQAANEPA